MRDRLTEIRTDALIELSRNLEAIHQQYKLTIHQQNMISHCYTDTERILRETFDSCQVEAENNSLSELSSVLQRNCNFSHHLSNHSKLIDESSGAYPKALESVANAYKKCAEEIVVLKTELGLATKNESTSAPKK